VKRGARLGAVLYAALALAACSEELPLTEIVLAVDSDNPAIERIEIQIENFGDGKTIKEPITDENDWPRSLSLVHDGGPLGPIHITVRGYGEGDEPLITEPRRDIDFKQDQTLLLRVELWADCVNLCTEEAEPACIHGEDDEPVCKSAEDAVELTKWNGSLSGGGAGGSGDGDAMVDGMIVDRDGGGRDGNVVDPPDSGGPAVDAGDPNAPSGDFPYTPSNFLPEDDAVGALERRSVTFDCGDVIYSSDDDSFSTDCARELPVVTSVPNGGLMAKLLVFDDFTLAQGSSLTIVGSQPVILAVFGDANIAGRIDASATGTQPGPGGNLNCPAGAGQNGDDGSSAGGLGNFPTAEGGGGGGFGSSGARGGEGGNDPPEQGAGGGLEGAPNLSPLRGGCPGGAGGNSHNDDLGGGGGGGGGALQISVAGMMSISGSLSAAGGGGAGGGGQEAGGGGGGSGGAILLEAATLVVDAAAILAVNGGGGGAGHDQGNNDDPAAAGDDGQHDTTARAPGGAGANGAGSGGAGAAFEGSATAGANGTNRQEAVLGIMNPGDGAGGGGGGVGRIRLRGADSCVQPPGTYSPIPAVTCPDCKCGAPPEAYCERASAGVRGYFVCDAPLGWDAARASCTGAGMELAHVNDGAESAVLDTVVTGRADAWLGGHDATENIWRWSDDNGQFWSGDSSGTPTEGDGSSCAKGAAGCSFSAWGTSGSNQPDNTDPGGGEADCLALVPNDGWYDAKCSVAKPYVCEGL
jgi:hypothetical protein